jgi:hypothetical protein
MRKLDLKDKYIDKYIYDLLYIANMIVMVGLFNEPEEGGRGQENDRE